MGMAQSDRTYDAIVIGSGISGGWAAKELCDHGLKTLVLERGRDVRTSRITPRRIWHRGSCRTGATARKLIDENPLISKAAGLILSDCYKPTDQRTFSEGLERFRAECRSQRGKNFLELSRADRETFVRSVGRQAWFEPVRDLALGAYFSSETGMTQALRYVRVPGKYVGCMPLALGQPAWG
jgi:choline dehydrogenase-like flavoprotein